MEIGEFFSSAVLNAVDAKGRVSLPAGFRSVIDARRAAISEKSDERSIKVGQHGTRDCLQAYDQSYQRKLYRDIHERFADLPAAERQDAVEDALFEAFGGTVDIAYDGGGRMVLPPMFRKLAGIDDLAFFVGGADTFQIWSPDRYRASEAAKPRIIALLDQQAAERGGKP